MTGLQHWRQHVQLLATGFYSTEQMFFDLQAFGMSPLQKQGGGECRRLMEALLGQAAWGKGLKAAFLSPCLLIFFLLLTGGGWIPVESVCVFCGISRAPSGEGGKHQLGQALGAADDYGAPSHVSQQPREGI